MLRRYWRVGVLLFGIGFSLGTLIVLLFFSYPA